MKPLEIAKILGIKYRMTPPGTTEMWGDAHSIERLYWAGYHEGQQKASWPSTHTTFQLGDAVEKIKGSNWGWHDLTIYLGPLILTFTVYGRV